MTVTRERTVVRPPVEKPPVGPYRPVRIPVRWLGWTLGMLIVAAGAVLVTVALTGEESFEDIYEAESGLSLGAIHEPGYVVPSRWLGESDMTLEEFEGAVDTFDTLYESESGLSLGAIHEPGYLVPSRWLGESDMTLEEFELRVQAWQRFEANLADHLAPDPGPDHLR